MGNAIVTFDKENAIKVGNFVYDGTPGLYELVFKTMPNMENVTNEDKTTYYKILKASSAHLTSDQSRRKGDKSEKWKNIIKPILDIHDTPRNKKAMSGARLNLVHDSRKVRYVYFDDVNELVDRLRLLVSKIEAGNNSYHNEVLSIIEELREKGVISDVPKKFMPSY